MRLLLVTAHPDDEAGGFGGTLLKYAEAGVETHVICLTAGTAATHRGEAQTPEELSTTRRKEFALACDLLRVDKAEVLDYPDGGLASLELMPVVADLTLRIRSIRPHVVLTFGSEGAVTGHPDHSMAGIFTALAFQWAARENRFPEQLMDGIRFPEQLMDGIRPWRAHKLYCQTNNFEMPERPPVALSPSTAIINLTPRQIEGKVAAFKQHLSQAPLFDFFLRTVHARGTAERFHLAAASSPMDIKIESDLFEGITA